MKRYWSERIQQLVPYTPGEQPKNSVLIKLNTNENPYPPSSAVLEAVNSVVSSLRFYPDTECDELRGAISEVYGVAKNQIFMGNGSDEILALAFLAFFDTGKAIKFPDITYSFYPVYADLFKVPYELVPVNKDFTIPVNALEGSEGGVIIANPNAPTAIAMELPEIERILKANPDTVVIVDEAYVEFGADTAVPLIGRYPNLLIVRTTSKAYSLAGLRVGWAMGDENLIAALNVVKNSFNSYTLDTLAIKGAAAAIRDREYFEKCCAMIVSTRERYAALLREMNFYVTSSGANFLFVSHEKVKADVIFTELRKRGILVRYWNKLRIDNFLRITVGTDSEMSKLVDELKSIV